MNINRYLLKVSLFCLVCSFIWLSNLFWKSKKTIIHSIVLDNNLSLLKLWIMLGADVNSNISIIGKPLHIAIESNNFAAAEILISNGANVNTETNLNVTPFYLVGKSHNLKIIKLLLTNNVNFSEQVLPFTISLKTLINNDSRLLEIFEKNFFKNMKNKHD